MKKHIIFIATLLLLRGTIAMTQAPVTKGIIPGNIDTQTVTQGSPTVMNMPKYYDGVVKPIIGMPHLKFNLDERKANFKEDDRSTLPNGNRLGLPQLTSYYSPKREQRKAALNNKYKELEKKYPAPAVKKAQASVPTAASRASDAKADVEWQEQ